MEDGLRLFWSFQTSKRMHIYSSLVIPEKTDRQADQPTNHNKRGYFDTIVLFV